MTPIRPSPGRPRTTLVAIVVLAAAVLLAGCGIGARNAPPLPSPSPTASVRLSDAVALARIQIESALKLRELAVIEPTDPYRPGEAPALAAAPRLVLQAVLPETPTGGYIVVYDFPTAGAAYTAALQMGAYLESGQGRIQFPPDARHVLRQLGSTVIFLSWSPSTVSDPRMDDVAAALETLGTGIQIRR